MIPCKPFLGLSLTDLDLDLATVEVADVSELENCGIDITPTMEDREWSVDAERKVPSLTNSSDSESEEAPTESELVAAKREEIEKKFGVSKNAAHEWEDPEFRDFCRGKAIQVVPKRDSISSFCSLPSESQKKLERFFGQSPMKKSNESASTLPSRSVSP